MSEDTIMSEEEIRASIGKNIAKFRKKKGLSQKEFAALIDIGAPNLSYIENGKYTPRLNTLIKMSEVLDVELYEFFIFFRHVAKENITNNLKKALEEDESLLRLIYRLYLAIKADYSPQKEEKEYVINSESLSPQIKRYAHAKHK